MKPKTKARAKKRNVSWIIEMNPCGEGWFPNNRRGAFLNRKSAEDALKQAKDLISGWDYRVTRYEATR